MTQRALSSRLPGMPSGMFRISFITFAESCRRSLIFALSSLSAAFTAVIVPANIAAHASSPSALLNIWYLQKAPAAEAAGYLSYRTSSGSSNETTQQSEQEQNQEYEEQKLRDTRRRNGDPCKAENRGDHGDHEKCQRPTKHVVLLACARRGRPHAAIDTSCLRKLRLSLNTGSLVFRRGLKPHFRLTANISFTCEKQRFRRVRSGVCRTSHLSAPIQQAADLLTCAFLLGF